MSMSNAAEASAVRILILAPSGRDAPAVAEIIVRAGLDPRILPDLEALCLAIGDNSGPIVIAEEALDRSERVEALARRLADQPAWSELPVLLISKASGRSAGRSAEERIGGYRNVVMLERPLRSAVLVSALQSAVKARRRQYDIRDHLLERASQAAELRGLNETLE